MNDDAHVVAQSVEDFDLIAFAPTHRDRLQGNLWRYAGIGEPEHEAASVANHDALAGDD